MVDPCLLMKTVHPQTDPKVQLQTDPEVQLQTDPKVQLQLQGITPDRHIQIHRVELHYPLRPALIGKGCKLATFFRTPGGTMV